MHQIKLLFTLLFSVLIFSLQAGEVILYTQVSNPTSSYVGFAYKKTVDAENASFFRMDLNAQNAAQMQLSLDASKFVELHYNNQIIKLYLETGDDLKIFLDGNNPQKSIRFEGRGSANNNLLAQYHQSYRSAEQRTFEGGYLKVNIDEKALRQAAASPAAAYATELQSEQSQQIQLLKNNRSQVSTFLYDYLQTEIEYTNATNRIAWFLENRYQPIQRSKSSIPVLKGVSIKNDKLLSHPAYSNFLNAYLFYLYLPEDLSRFKVHYPLYKIVQEKFSGRVKYHLLSELLVKVYERSGNAEFAHKHFRDFVNQNPYPEYTDKVLAMYGGVLSGTPDVAAPDFDMMDDKRKVISLSDYEGKVVYLSFWASWCKPCIEGFKKSADIRKQMQDMGVVLLNVSIDKKEEAWRDAMIRHNPIGVNGLVLSLEDISKKYDISSIPLYQIIDKNGKFAFLSDNAQRNILEEFRQLVRR